MIGSGAGSEGVGPDQRGQGPSPWVREGQGGV